MMRSIDPKLASKVLVLFTGGTIGMIRNKEHVLVPAKGCLSDFIRKDPQTHDVNYVFPNEESSKLLILPYISGLKRVTYEIYEYDTLLDSSNMDTSDWEKIACDIKTFYKLYDGFVVLHGTDTLAYTSSALSFMLENLGKPVVVTGSQVPILEPVSDGKDNFICSVAIAGNFLIPEVTVFFNHELFRGNRVIKLSSNTFEAFQTYNYPPLAKVGTSFEVDDRFAMKPSSTAEFTVHNHVSDKVCLMKIYPGIQAQTVKSLLQPPIQGVVIQTFGAGNMPTRERTGLFELFKEAVERGIIVVNVTQCPTGGVCAAYEPGKAFYDLGVLPGYDMTPEAAFAKLCYVLSKEEWDLYEKKKKMTQSLRGELSGSGTTSYAELDLIDAVSQYLKLTSVEQRQHLSKILTPALVMDAVVTANLTKLNELKNMGADFSIANTDLRTPLHVACTYGNADVIRFLLSNGAKLHIRDSNGNFPLVEAIRHSPIEVVRLLLANGAHLSMDETELGSELGRAAAKGNVSLLKRFIMAGADLNATDQDGRTPLHMACLHEQVDVTRFLLHKGVRRDKLDILGHRPINYARHTQNPAVLAALEGVLNTNGDLS